MPKLQSYGVRRLNPSQIGFVQKRSVTDNIIRLHVEAKKYQNSGYLLFLDFSSAYDTINRKLLYQRLKDKQVLADEEIEIIKFIHSNIRIKLGGKKCHTETGVPQGLMSSPILFNVFVEDLLDKLDQFGITTLAYADDFALILKDKDSVKKSIEFIQSWSRENSMILNKQKSGIVSLVGKRKRNLIEDNEIEGVPIVDSYKYLGIET